MPTLDENTDSATFPKETHDEKHGEVVLLRDDRPARVRPGDCPGPAADDEGFKPIFDGKTLEGWDGNPKLWRVEDGAITGETTAENPTKGNTFLIWRGGKPADFELKAEFRMPNQGFANSGIQIRSWEGPNEVARRRLPGRHGRATTPTPASSTASASAASSPAAARRSSSARTTSRRSSSSSATRNELAKVDQEAATGTSTTSSPRATTSSSKINGQLMCELTDEDTVARKDGIIALQLHAGPPMKVQFRNIRLKELEARQPDEGRRARRRSCSSPAARATATPTTSTTPAACCWPSASNESGLPVEAVVYEGLAEGRRAPWTAPTRSSSSPTAAAGIP